MKPISTTPLRRRCAYWLAGIPLLALVLVGGGCGTSARTADPNEGRKALQTMLDAWKSGAKPEVLAQQSPSIHASDGDWMAGLALQNYETSDEGTLVGTDLNYSVVLELKNRKGRVTKKTAVYSVTTHPQLLVLRQD